MKKLYFLLLLAFCTIESNAQIVNIPDPVFKNLLVNTNCTDLDGGDIYSIDTDVDSNNDGEIQLSEALAVKVLEIGGVDTFDMSGIEAFSNIDFVYFYSFDHLDIDLSGVPSLTALALHTGTINSLNLSGLVNLKNINAAYCNFPTTDFSSLTGLEIIGLYDGTIPSLDLSNLPSLKEIEVSGAPGASMSAINVEGLTNLEMLQCYNFGLTQIDLSDLTNLKKLYCGGNALTSLDLSNQDNLIEFGCDDNQLASLDISNLTQLEILECSNNLFSSLDISNLTQLKNLYCNGNQLTDLDVSNASQLNHLHCNNNQLTTLNLSNSVNLWDLNCANNQLTSLNTTNLTKLGWANVKNNLFTSLDFSYSQWPHWGNLDFSDNPNLSYINVKNGAPFWFHHGNGFKAGNCPNLQYICADEYNFSEIDVPQAQITSYCSFTPGGIFNTISGTLTYDLNNNGCDATDVLSLNSKMKLTNGSSNGITFTNASGGYSFFTQAGNFTLTPEFESSYFTVSPASAVINFAAADGSTQTQNFCVTPNGIHNDVAITLIPIGSSRPGFDANYKLVYENKGNQVISGNINLTFNDAVLDFVSAFPATSSQSLNNLNWNYETLLPFQTRTIDFTLNVNSPQETPAVNLGDILNFDAYINPVSGDETIADNTFHLTQTVTGSFDPNDKICLEGTTINPEKIGDYLNYVIRFENAGTAAAENIVVKDVLDSNKFDVASFKLVSSSHPHVTRITGNKVEFIFEGINLPPAIEDEAGSHGYVVFKVKTKNTVVLGDAINNIADIFFDYNFPITTEPATTTVSLLATNNFDDTSVSVYPNPVKDQLRIAAMDAIISIQLYDVLGRLIQTTRQNSKDVIFDFRQQPAGVYLVKIQTEKGIKTEKIIKE